MTNHIVLFEPQIPPNTGNIARTCAGTNSSLHLIEPLGFKLDDKHLKRAGLDYWDELDVYIHESLDTFMATIDPSDLFLITKFAEQIYSDQDFSETEKDYYLMFGKETTGLPEEFMKKYADKCLRLPMNDEHVRSLNLSNTAAIVIYEVLRQQNFAHLELVHHYEKDKLK